MDTNTIQDVQPSARQGGADQLNDQDLDFDRRICSLYNHFLASGKTGPEIRNEWGDAPAMRPC